MSICTAVLPPGSLPLTFRLSGFEPDDVKDASQADRLRYWSIVGVIAERVKQNELQRGLDRFGRKLKPVQVRKIRFKRSGRTIDGEPLMPHRGLSRTRRLLRYTVNYSGVTFWWGNDWGVILDYHRRGACLKRDGVIVGKLPVRDVFGISPAGISKIKDEAYRHWRNGTKPEKKIAGNMTDSGLGIELPFDNTAKQRAPGQGAAKPPGEWKQRDYLFAGINVVRSEAKVRTVNTATGVTGARRTGFRVTVDWNKNLPWKSSLNRK